MSYYEDLSKYQYTKNNEPEDVLNIGWLDCSQEFTKGEVPKEFVDKLWGFLRVKVEEKRGFHECNLCSIDTGYLSVTNKIETLYLGSAEIRVIGSDGKVYASPNLIYHYVIEHNYQPPIEFINAVLYGYPPDSKEYINYLKENHDKQATNSEEYMNLKKNNDLIGSKKSFIKKLFKCLER